MLKLIIEILKEAWTGLLILAGVYGFLSFCAWDLNPAEWNGFSRFLGIVAILIVGNIFREVIKDRKNQYKNKRLREKER